MSAPPERQPRSEDQANMKRQIIITAILLLLAVIGVERLNRPRQIEPQPESSAVSEISNTRSASKNRAPVYSAKPPPYTPAAETARATGPTIPVIARAPMQTAGTASSQQAPQIFHIRGESILKTSEPDKESIARLWEAVERVASTFGEPVIIIDLDGLATSGSRLLAYANPEFDLTQPTGAAYRALAGKEASAANQDVSGQNPTD